MVNADRAAMVAGVVAKGTQGASTMSPESSAFDVWSHSYDGLTSNLESFANDPAGAIRNRQLQDDRMLEAMSPEHWQSSSGQQVLNSMEAQYNALGDLLGSLGEGTVQNPDGTMRPKSALEYVGQGFQLLTGAEQMLSTLVSAIPFPAFPAVRIMDFDVGLPHAHAHPPNLIPPAPPVPLPSTGPIIPIPILSGASKTLINGMPAARCGDMGLGIWCGGYFPMYEVFLGSSNVWIEGARAGRLLCDITKHCVFTVPKPSDPPMGPMVGTTISSSSNVMIGGFPMPSLLSLAMGAAFKGMFKALGAGGRAFSRASGRLGRRLGRNMKPGFLKCRILRAEPVNIVTGEVVVDQQDFSINGRIAIVWNRHYGSQSTRMGVCGYGWETPADARLVFEEDGFIAFHDGTGVAAFFDSLPLDGPVREPVDGGRLHKVERHYAVRLKSGLTYYFPIPDQPKREILVDIIMDPCRNTLTFERDKHGLRRISESAGRWIDVKSQSGLIHQMQMRHPEYEDSCALVRFEYDEHGDLIAVYDALEAPYRFRYQAHRLIQHTDRNDLSFYYEYDNYTSEGRCYHTWGDGGLYDYRFRFNPLGQETQVTNSLGHVWIVEYNDAFQVVKEVDPLDGATLYEYDTVGRTSAVVDPSGNRTEYRYDGDGNLDKLTRADGLSIQTLFGSPGKPVKIVDPNGGDWRQKWNSKGLLEQQKTPLGNLSRYKYNYHGDLAVFINPRRARTELSYDDIGNLICVKDPLGHCTEFSYSITGNVVSKKDPLGQETLYRYDAKDRLSEIQLPSGSRLHFAYDGADNLIAYSDQSGGQTRYEYFGLGEITRIVQPDGHSVRYLYDTEEQLVGVLNQRGELYKLKRDALGRIVEEVDYWGQSRIYRHSACGFLERCTNPLGEDIEYINDPLGRVVKKVVTNESAPAETVVESFGYDAVGNLIEAANPHCNITRSFDAEGRLLEESQGDSFSIANKYDENGNRIQRITEYKNGKSGSSFCVRYSYDLLDQVCDIALDDGTLIRIGRDGARRIVTEQLGSALKRETSYSNDGYPSKQLVRNHSSTLSNVAYKYDAVGNLIQRIDDQMGSDSYTYDPVGRITQHVEAGGGVKQYLNDSAGDRLVSEVFDRHSSKLDSSKETGLALLDGDLDKKQQKEKVWIRQGEYQGSVHRFDGAGNMIYRGRANVDMTLTWDSNHRLSETCLNGTSTRYRYDPLGRRIDKTTNDKCVRFAWDGDALVGDMRPSSGFGEDHTKVAVEAVREWVYLGDGFEPLALQVEEAESRGVCFYHNDPNGCPTKMTDHTGNIKWAATYRAWGEIDTHKLDITANPIRYQGQYFDDESGLHYNRYRYYDPHIGQFISQDPLGLEPSDNVYEFAPNPVSWIDPWGLACGPAVRRNSRGQWIDANGKFAQAPPRPRYTAQSRHHVFTHGHASNSPPVIHSVTGAVVPKSKFRPTQGGANFADEVYNHPNVQVTHQWNGRVRYDVADMGRTTGTGMHGGHVRGGRVVVEANPSANPLYNPDDVVTQFPV